MKKIAASIDRLLAEIPEVKELPAMSQVRLRSLLINFVAEDHRTLCNEVQMRLGLVGVHLNETRIDLERIMHPASDP